MKTPLHTKPEDQDIRDSYDDAEQAKCVNKTYVCGTGLNFSTRIYEYRDSIRKGRHKRFRRDNLPDVLSECEKKKLTWMQRIALLTQRMCEAEVVVIEIGRASCRERV